MLLIAAGLYYLISGVCYISPSVGLKGSGAQWAGAICIGIGLISFFFLKSILALLAAMIGLGPIGMMVLWFFGHIVVQLAVLWLILMLMVKNFGNSFAAMASNLASGYQYGVRARMLGLIITIPIVILFLVALFISIEAH